MNAQGLLELLLQYQADGIDLTKLDVVSVQTTYDSGIQYDRGIEQEHYVNDVEIENDQLRIL